MTYLLQILVGIGLLFLGVMTVTRMETMRQLNRRADEICGLPAEGLQAVADARARLTPWQQVFALLNRLGLRTSSYASQLYLAASPLVIAMAWTLAGWQTAGLAAIAAVAGNVLIIRGVEIRRARRFTRKLPAFLERVRRFVLIGNTFQQAFIQAAKENDPLLKAYIDPLLRRVRHGAPLVDGIDHLARDVDTSELYMLAAYVRTNAKFGGRVADNLNNLITQIASKERLEREIAALTGETRASAIILLGLTVALIAFVSITNHGYLDFFFDNDKGQILLAVIVLWPLIGLLVMRRILDLDL